MAVTAEPRATTEPPERRPRSGLELWAWLFMRFSGILLLFVAERWSSPFWRTWDWMMLSLSLLHGINGVRVIVQDYVRGPGWRLVWNWSFGIVGFTLFVLGSVIVFTFD